MPYNTRSFIFNKPPGSEERTKDLTLAITMLKKSGVNDMVKENNLVEQYFETYYKSKGISKPSWNKLIRATFSNSKADELMRKYEAYHE